MLLRWAVVVFIVLLLLDSTTGILGKLPRLPGDVHWRIGQRTLRLPFASALVLTGLLLVGIKLLAWLALQF
ncbi:MAG: DUF2905 family protein [Comamonas sp.]|jgi:hypothetical protein|nr:DUF2905 family protein [Comamonas sp.]